MKTTDTTGMRLELDQLRGNRETLSDIIHEKECVLYDAVCHNARIRFHSNHAFPGWEYVKKCDITCMSTLKMASHYSEVPEQCISRLSLSQLAYLVAQLHTVIAPDDRRVSVVASLYHDGTRFVEKTKKHLLRDHVIFLCDNGCDNCGIVSHTTDVCCYSDTNQPPQYTSPQPSPPKGLSLQSTKKPRKRNRNRNRNKKSNTPSEVL